tara:strand:+ start:145 stop:555 length:411 start_codon:yes stop_codon:yes gene_type:complete
MARGINKVILIGNLGRDPEVTYSASGMAIAAFVVATTEGRKNANGEWKDKTEWHRTKAFGKTAETIGKYLTKGSQVYIEGRIQYDKYQHKDGHMVYTTDIICNKMNMLGGGGESKAQAPQQEKGVEPDDSDNSLPF